jgi:hypothetical protein
MQARGLQSGFNREIPALSGSWRWRSVKGKESSSSSNTPAATTLYASTYDWCVMAHQQSRQAIELMHGKEASKFRWGAKGRMLDRMALELCHWRREFWN